MIGGPSGAASNHVIGSRRLRFGPFEVDLGTGELRKEGHRIRVPHQSFQILAMLLEKHGQVVTREALRLELWPSDVFVDFERSLNSAVRRLRSGLQDSAERARYIETLPKLGYRFVAAVEQVIPASESSQALANEGATEFSSAPETSEKLSTVASVRRGNWKDGPLAVFILVWLVALIPYLWRQYLRHRTPPPAQAQQLSVLIPSSRRRSVAVMGFKNVSGNAQSLWLSTAFTEMLATEMAAGDQLRTVAEEHVARAKLELSLIDKDSYASDTLSKIHANLGCDYIIVGSYLALGQGSKGRVRLDARMQDTVTGETVANVAVSGAQSDLFDLVSRAGERLRAKLNVEPSSPPESEGVRAALPAAPEAVRLYSEGLAKLRLYDNVAARDLMQKVVRLEPRYSPAYSALATAWSNLGYDAQAAKAARQAMDLSGNLPERLQLDAGGRNREMTGEWPQAVEIYLRLQRSYPDDLDYGLRLARAQNSMDNSAGAAGTLAALRKLPSPQRDDPRIDLVEAETAGELSDFKRELTLAESAVRKAEIAGARLVLSRGKLVEGWAFDDLGNFDKALEAYAVVERISAEFGDLHLSALALMNAGIVLVKQGDPAGAVDKIKRARDLFRKEGNQGSLAAALSNLGSIYGEQGELVEAERFFREARTILNEIGQQSKRDGITNNLGAVLQRRGKFREAKDMLEPVVEHLHRSGKKIILGEALESLGLIAEAQGDMPTAVEDYREAVSLFQEMGDKSEYAAAEQTLGKGYLAQGDFQSANRMLSDALSIDREISAKAAAALDQVALAKVILEQGQLADLSTLRAAQEELGLEKMTDSEIHAETVIARELIRRGEIEEAAKLISSATALSARSYDPTVRFEVALNTAHLQTAQHRFADASRTLRPATERAARLGCVSCQLEARLEMAGIEMARGNLERGRSQLRDLANEAQRRGFGLIAQQATTDAK